MDPLLIDPVACPGCGLDPEISAYYRRGNKRVGYQCTCGAVVIDGIVQCFMGAGQ